MKIRHVLPLALFVLALGNAAVWLARHAAQEQAHMQTLAVQVDGPPGLEVIHASR
jgi:hypothetical protein